MTDKVVNVVQKLRKDAGITQEEFARGVGVTRQTIIAIEKGNYVPSVFLALKIATYFKVEVSSIFKLSK